MSLSKQIKEQRKKNLLFALAMLGGYLIVYLAGRIFGTVKEPVSIIGWLFGTDPRQLSYLYGWLLHQHLFLLAVAVSVVAALLGKRIFAFMAWFGFATGLLLGELCGKNPAGAAYGHGHDGWLIWGGIFAFSLVMGAVLEKHAKGKIDLRSPKMRIWAVLLIFGILAIVLLVRATMPTSFR